MTWLFFYLCSLIQVEKRRGSIRLWKTLRYTFYNRMIILPLDIKITENIHTDNMNIKMFIICLDTSYTWLEHFNISRKEVWLFSFTMHIMFKTNLMKCNKAYSSNYTISAHKGSTKINELIEDAFVSRIKSFVIPKLR